MATISASMWIDLLEYTTIFKEFMDTFKVSAGVNWSTYCILEISFQLREKNTFIWVLAIEYYQLYPLKYLTGAGKESFY